MFVPSSMNRLMSKRFNKSQNCIDHTSLNKHLEYLIYQYGSQLNSKENKWYFGILSFLIFDFFLIQLVKKGWRWEIHNCREISPRQFWECLIFKQFSFKSIALNSIQLKRSAKEDIILPVENYQKCDGHKKEYLKKEQLWVCNLLLLEIAQFLKLQTRKPKGCEREDMINS